MVLRILLRHIGIKALSTALVLWNEVGELSKSALIIDTPKTCVDCMFYFDLGEFDKYCSVKDDEKDSDTCREITPTDKFRQERPDWCPLKELPEEEHNEYYLDEYCDGYDDGWNTFRSRILGENKNV